MAMPRRSIVRQVFDRFLIFDRRWVAEAFSRESIIDSLKTLIWVVPLTLLIWVYAEREQVYRVRGASIPFNLISQQPGKLVRVKPPQDSNVLIDCEGPRARVDEALRQIRAGQSQTPGLNLYVDTRNADPERDFQIPLAQLIANHPIFMQYGITVTRCQPEKAFIIVDPIIERTATVAIPPSIDVLEPQTTFDPPFIKVTGPQSAIAAAERQGKNGALVVYAHVQDRPELKTPGEHAVTGIPLDLPDSLRDGQQVKLSARAVNATLSVRSPETEKTLPSIAVLSTVPVGFGQDYKLTFNSSLTNVTLIGSADALATLELPDAKQPYATFTVFSADVADPKPKPLIFLNLPDGVRVSDKDKNRTISVEVTQKNAGAE